MNRNTMYTDILNGIHFAKKKQQNINYQQFPFYIHLSLHLRKLQQQKIKKLKIHKWNCLFSLNLREVGRVCHPNEAKIVWQDFYRTNCAEKRFESDFNSENLIKKGWFGWEAGNCVIRLFELWIICFDSSEMRPWEKFKISYEIIHWMGSFCIFLKRNFR